MHIETNKIHKCDITWSTFDNINMLLSIIIIIIIIIIIMKEKITSNAWQQWVDSEKSQTKT